MKKIRYFVLAILLVAAVYVWALVFGSTEAKLLEVDFFDVGQGDSIFIEYEDKQVLIDGGPDATVLEKLGTEMDFFDRYIDIVILTHPDKDHFAGLIEVLKNFQIGLILTNGQSEDSVSYQALADLIKEKNIPFKIALAGQRIDLSQGIELRILAPASSYQPSEQTDNNYSVAVQLVYNQSEFLFAADMEKEAELNLVSQGTDIESDVLKVGHHGSKNSTNPLFLQKVNPKIAVISVGQNSYGHPTQEVLDRLKGIELFRTDLNADVEILSDGQSLTVNKER